MMLELRSAIYSACITNATINGVLKGNVFFGVAPQQAPYPYAVISNISDVPSKTFSEQYDLVRMRLDVYSQLSSPTEVETVYEAYVAMMDDAQLVLGTGTLRIVRCDRENSSLTLQTEVTPAATGREYVYQVDYKIYIQH
jgi:hypothetical protein